MLRAIPRSVRFASVAVVRAVGADDQSPPEPTAPPLTTTTTTAAATTTTTTTTTATTTTTTTTSSTTLVTRTTVSPMVASPRDRQTRMSGEHNQFASAPTSNARQPNSHKQPSRCVSRPADRLVKANSNASGRPRKSRRSTAARPQNCQNGRLRVDRVLRLPRRR